MEGLPNSRLYVLVEPSRLKAATSMMFPESTTLPCIVFTTTGMSPAPYCLFDSNKRMDHSFRYLDHLTEGAQHWQLDPQYTSWLTHQPSIAAEQRGDEYYTSAIDGQPLKAWPKIRTGGQQQRQQQRGRGGYGRGKR